MKKFIVILITLLFLQISNSYGDVLLKRTNLVFKVIDKADFNIIAFDWKVIFEVNGKIGIPENVLK